MKMTRRKFVFTSLGIAAAAAGCSTGRDMIAAVPGPAWPTGRPQTPAAPPTVSPPPQYNTVPQPSSDWSVIPRSVWEKQPPVLGRINPMDGIRYITVHHEGWEVVNFTDANQTIDRLRKIHDYHTSTLGWGDTGYHFIIDRAGRVWEARPLQYQGAHVKDHNEHNIGVMCLGNFDNQYPSAAQLASLRNSLDHLRTMYQVPVRSVYTHQELNPTRCPGVQLQTQMVSLRRNGYFA